MYAEAQAAAPAADGGRCSRPTAVPTAPPRDDDVVDAEIVDEDETPEGESK